ncbi:NACHT domain-containing protein [Mesorhizobium sp. 113-1-2]|uniref:NACHT domain-containing protein n=1 Tax=Mesorhizobium sp. 113-1-2 TaxID=2744515 RepID=UPI00192592B3|nr:NACHT domain-containing protein [Mesorhizobium sp. 113-1-2]
MSDIDPNKIAIGVGTALVKDFLTGFSDSVTKTISKKYAQYFSNFAPYLEKMHTTCSSVKTIINKESPVKINEIYVKTKFRCKNQIVDDDSLCQEIRDNKRIVVTGFGGIGKTIFCKYFFMSVFQNSGGKIPIFLELRRLNEISQKNLLAIMRVSSSAEKDVVSEDVFRAMMEDGRFIFILDGFDEIPDEFRNDIQRQILELSHLYPNCGIVVSSRNDDRFSSWQQFFLFQALPFEKDQTLEVISKTEFDPDTKKEFVQNILNKRYSEYKGFFSTPLLTLMMLMTYLQIRHIPDNIHVFYRYAFQTLFTLHDASKQGFQRKRRLSLGEQEFIEVFSYFCISTYVEMEHTFTEQKCLEYIDRAKRRANQTFDSKDFLVDATESVNMFFKDGDQYSFIHRTFQEYFTAYSLTHYFVPNLREAVKIIPLRETDSVFSMIRAINPALVDDLYTVPEYNYWAVIIRQVLRETDPVEILKLNDHNLQIRFVLKRDEVSTYMFGSFGDPGVENFVNSVYLMFKPQAPKELDYSPSMKPILASASAIGRYIARKRLVKDAQEMEFEAKFNFTKRAVEVQAFSGENESQSEKFLLSFDDLNWSKNLPIITTSAEKIKARVSFVKRKIDEITRSRKQSRGNGGDILAL